MLSRGARQDWEKKPASVYRRWSFAFIVLPIRLLMLCLAIESSRTAKACSMGL